MSTTLELPIARAFDPTIVTAPIAPVADPVVFDEPAAPGGLITPEDLLAMDDAVGHELVDGILVERHVSKLSSLVALELGALLRIYVKPRSLGWVFGSDLGYRCFPDKPGKVRKPDASFVLLDRMPVESLGEGYATVAPDLAVEVISPNDLAEELESKVLEYVAAGVPLIWLVYPELRLVRVQRGRAATLLGPEDDLDGEAVLPGFRVRVASLFPVAPEPSESAAI